MNATVEPDRAVAESLPEGQKNCLRLVATGMSSKEIAQKTGLSPQTVDTYIKAAMARLGSSNRRDAARLLLSLEASQKSGSPPASIAAAAPSPQQDPGTGRRWGAWALPPIGGSENKLGAAERTFAVLRIAGVSATAVIALALLIAGALKVFR